jgi:putative membrane protein
MAGKAARTAGALALAAITMMACAKKDDETAADTTAATNATNTMAGSDTAAAASSTAAAPAGLTDANIVAILDAANMSDSTWGAIAATKGTSKDVREFGKTMMRDHHALRKAGQDLAKKLGVTPQPPADDNSQQTLQSTSDMLNGTAKGKDFDKAYIDHEVDYHKQVLETATKAMAAAQNSELKNLIQKAAPNLQAHLNAAEAIQKKMT